MNINISAQNLDLTDAYKTYIEEKLHSLDKFVSKIDPDSVQAWVIVARTTNHHKHGDVYHTEVNLRVSGETYRARAEGADARAIIDEVKDRLKEELIKHKEKNLHH